VRDTPSAELWEWPLQPSDRYLAQPDSHGSEELLLILQGALTFQDEGLDSVSVAPPGSPATAATPTSTTGRRDAIHPCHAPRL